MDPYPSFDPNVTEYWKLKIDCKSNPGQVPKLCEYLQNYILNEFFIVSLYISITLSNNKLISIVNEKQRILSHPED